MIYAEEISHCAAGVRWLKHLHSVAHEHDLQQGQQLGQQRGQQQVQQRGQQQGQQQQAASSTALGGAAAPAADTSAAAPASGESQQQQQRQQPQEQLPCVVPEWAAEARQHPTVEAWFHSLIRRHFFGRLKPPFNDEARAQAGFGPEWYLPLAVAAADGAGAADAAAAEEDG